MGDDIPLTIYEVQQGAASHDERIVLTDVVVTTPAAAGELIGGVELFVQELAGGPFSGLRIQAPDAELVALLAPGDTAEIHGRVRIGFGYYLLVVESSDDIVVTGTATAPEPTVVPVSALAPSSPSARSYEGVVVRVEQATVTDADPCDGEFILDDIVRVDDRFMPQAVPTPTPGQVFSSVRGVFVHASGTYELAPPDPTAIE